MKHRIYLDNCCFNRPYDDQLQPRVRFETQAKLYIQKMIYDLEVELVWSYVLKYEYKDDRISICNPIEFFNQIEI